MVFSGHGKPGAEVGLKVYREDLKSSLEYGQVTLGPSSIGDLDFTVASSDANVGFQTKAPLRRSENHPHCAFNHDEDNEDDKLFLFLFLFWGQGLTM